MAEHQPGSMDITEQKKTFAMFVRALIWNVAVIAAILIFLALFAT